MTTKTILSAVCLELGIDHADIASVSRKGRYVKGRRMYAGLCRDLLKNGSQAEGRPKIGRPKVEGSYPSIVSLTGTCHSSAITWHRDHLRMMESDAEYRTTYEGMRARLQEFKPYYTEDIGHGYAQIIRRDPRGDYIVLTCKEAEDVAVMVDELNRRAVEGERVVSK